MSSIISAEYWGYLSYYVIFYNSLILQWKFAWEGSVPASVQEKTFTEITPITCTNSIYLINVQEEKTNPGMINARQLLVRPIELNGSEIIYKVVSTSENFNNVGYRRVILVIGKI